MADRLLLEAGAGALLLEAGAGAILLESAPATNAPAEVATGTGAASQPAAKVASSGGVAAATGSAGSPTVSQTTFAGQPAGTGAASAPAGKTAPTAGVAAGTGVAQTPAVALSTYAAAATGETTGIGTAYDAQTGAWPALGTGAAPAVSVSIMVAPDVAVGMGAALGALIATINANAERAVGFGSAYGATTPPVTAQGRGTAYDAIVGGIALFKGFQPDAFQVGFQGGVVGPVVIPEPFPPLAEYIEDQVARFYANVPLNMQLRGGFEIVGPAGTIHNIPAGLYDEFLRDQVPLIPGGVIWVTNVSDASTLSGAVVKKIQVFDANGNSIGYVPVYNTIT